MTMWGRPLTLHCRFSNDPIYLPDIPRSRDLIAPEVRRRINNAVMGASPWPLVLIGDVGTGKTCAALCLMDAVGHGCEHRMVCELTDDLISASRGELWAEAQRMTVPKFWRLWREAPLTVLDELGTREKVSDFCFESVKRAIDARENLPSVVISNLPIAALARAYDDRIASRLSAGTVIQFACEDRRLAQHTGATK